MFAEDEKPFVRISREKPLLAKTDTERRPVARTTSYRVFATRFSHCLLHA
jgi:hypothetical protein